MNYRVIQLTNNNLPAVSANENLPLGGITRSIRPKNGCCPTMTVSASLVINGTALYTASASAAAVGDVVNLSFVYQTKVCPCCGGTPVSCPANVRISLGDGAVTGGTSNLLIERVYI